MKKSILITSLLAVTALNAQAEEWKVSKANFVGPYSVQSPYLIDNTNAKGHKYDASELINTDLRLDDVFATGAKQIEAVNGEFIISNEDKDYSLYLLGFKINNVKYAKGTIKVNGLKDYKIFIDGKLSEENFSLDPSTHEVIIKYSRQGNKKDKVSISIDTKEDGLIEMADNGGRLYTLHDVLEGIRYSYGEVSPDGKYLLANYRNTLEGGNTYYPSYLIDLKSKAKLRSVPYGSKWMPKSGRFIYKDNATNEIVAINPKEGFKKEIIATNLPGRIDGISPNEDFFILSIETEGPKERKEIYEVIHPDDRQPGWRNRTNIAKYDIKKGIVQPLTYGYHNVWLTDISADGKKILFADQESRFSERPTTVYNMYLMNLETMEVEKIVDKDGFVNDCRFSPDASKVLIKGSPESLNSIGKKVLEGQIPNMFEHELYVMNLSDKKISTITKDFDPSIKNVKWSRVDGNIYCTAENFGYISLFRYNVKKEKWEQIDAKEENIKTISLADNAPVMVYSGVSVSNSDKVYTMNLKSDKFDILDDLSSEILKGVKLGECKEWDFKNSRGETIYGRYYTPPYFDENKKYPMIVYYYGGCSPSSRNFETNYPFQAYAALGYVVYVVNPAGATGFGQVHAARHVNTAGKGVAEDIIEGTKKFTKEHSFVNDKKIGCLGASYGGFMTQYLQTQTDIFAAAISHAGISDHTSYWGEGYWGYSYSEVSMANSYPWKDRKLFVDQSPLFNADKIHTPLLFVHGDDDHNVPVGESIQMYTALRLLGRPTALVLVEGQDHHIVDYKKKFMWQNTMFAWFQRYLKDDSSWWDALYPKKDL